MSEDSSLDSTNVEKSDQLQHVIENNPVRPCPGITYYNPFPTVWSGGIVPCTTSKGEGQTTTFGNIS